MYQFKVLAPPASPPQAVSAEDETTATASMASDRERGSAVCTSLPSTGSSLR
jgi:hypothetical protein